MKYPEYRRPDNSDDGADDEAVEGCATVLILVRGRVVVDAHRCLSIGAGGV